MYVYIQRDTYIYIYIYNHVYEGLRILPPSPRLRLTTCWLAGLLAVLAGLQTLPAPSMATGLACQCTYRYVLSTGFLGYFGSML